MLTASLFALMLAAADPAPGPAPEPAMPTLKSAPVAPPPEEPFPVGAPQDDYGFVSWCYGALSGHMELYKIVKPELDKLPDQDPKETAALDAEQLKAGQEYLALYKRAMEAAEKASPQPINARGGQAVKAGGNIWAPALQADPKTRMWSYLSWDLPGRCETTAEKLFEKSQLAAEALGITIEDAPREAATTSTASAAPKPAAAPKPTPKVDLRGLE